MQLLTFLITTATLLPSAFAQDEIDWDEIDPETGKPFVYDQCYCKIGKEYAGVAMKDLGVTNYCCDATVGVGLFDKEKEVCPPALVGVGGPEEDSFQKCCVALFAQSSCYDPEKATKTLYTKAHIVGLDNKGKLRFDDIEGGEPLK